MIKYLSARRKGISVFCSFLFLFQMLHPMVSLALTSGPTQPEVHSFQSASTTEMVDLFSGDFSYNIPLFELPGPSGGYPFNLSYQAGIGMDQEATWVGLGWSLNPGTITRQMRGLPDEFKGDDITTKMSVKPSVTVGLGSGASMEAFGADGLSLKGGFSVSHNNYKGIGYSLDGSVGFAKAAGGGMTGGVGLDFSLDSQEGVSLQPSLSLSGKIGEVGLGAGYNSKSGLSNISYFQSINYTLTGKGDKCYGVRANKTAKTMFSNSATLSLAHPGYTPQITMPMKNLNLSAEFRPGASWWGIFGHLYIRGFYNEQRLDKDKKVMTADAYGYMNYQYASSPKALLDFNREKDGMVTKESPNLSIPSLTYDIYSVTGQGISAMYRPMRNDYGIIYDQESSSVANGGSVGVDIGPAATHVGVNLSINHSRSTSGAWRENNSMADRGKFQSKNINDKYEPWYFKVHGEAATESESVISKLGGEKAVRISLSDSRSNTVALASIENKTWGSHAAPDNKTENRERKPRNQVIQTLTNEQLLKGGTEEVLPEFRIAYLNESKAQQMLNRSSYPAHHIAGFTALTPEGLRYNYGLPAYNKRQEEVTFSAERPGGAVSKVLVKTHGEGDPQFSHATETDEYLKSVEIPQYTHSHLLTSILGPDYVDVSNNGVTDDDLGYWVKFTYQRTASSYKWREPFSQAHYQPGWRTDPRDDKGSFVYGEKELWFLATAETKSHIAEFVLANDRTDGKGVLNKLQDSDTETGQSVPRLEQIKLYTRIAGSASPIKIVKLEHDQSRCKGLYGNAANGKLTLTKLYFQYGGSNRGHLNPYIFTYSDVNPGYDNLQYDRWGNYRPYPGTQYDYNRDFPYVTQNPSGKTMLDANASAWSLKEIILPSGGKVIIDYETDDYAYVQHKPAMQMMEICNPEDFTNANFSLKDELLKIRFKLETPVNGTMSDPNLRKAEVLKYLDAKRDQLYFKLRVNLRSPGENFYEDIAGYASVNFAGPMDLEKDGTDAGNNYTHGYFHVVAEKGNNSKMHHPFSMRAWQHLRTNQPELANAGRKLKQTENQSERVDQIKSLGSIGTQVRTMFQGFYKFCSDKNWGREVVVGKSWIRLNSPDKIKYGGGHRVKQITMRDQWSENGESTSENREGTYGQVYEYTTEEDGKIISSGVAAFEPIVGGDENPLRYAKKYVQSVPLRADNNLYFEYPVNESYYPGPQIGYSKVTVWSLAAGSLAGKNINNVADDLFPKGAGISYGTTGKTVHEFYTAKDFPVITDETEKLNRPYKLSIPVPFLGNVSVSKLSTSQGYSIVTNDMHGKPKKVSNYRQDKSGIIEPEAISYVTYNYLSQPRVYEGERVNVLVNTLKENADKTVALATSSNAALPNILLGQETEFFADMREFEDKTWSGGARVNTDVMYIPIAFVVVPIPIPTVWPSIAKSQNQLRMAVTNKVIFKSGILVSTEAYDGGSNMITKNEKWDKVTGVPVLTKTNNNFDDPIYNYSILAHSQYDGIGAAYQNIGLTFDMTSVVKNPYKEGYYDFYATEQVKSSLYAGDEIILFEPGDELNKPLAKTIYMGEADGDNIIYSKQPLELKAYKCLIVRSGFRNQLAIPAGTITGLQDPSIKGTPFTYTKTISVVK
jgi:hypothetical protein